MIPSKEAIEYGRLMLGHTRDRYKKFYENAFNNGDLEAAKRWKRVVFMIEHDLLGREDGGCVILPFDERWLDDEFRAMMEDTHEQVRVSKGARRQSKPGQRRVPGNRGG